MQIRMDFRFTGLNDYIAAERAHLQKAAKIKHDETEVARMFSICHGAVDAYPVDLVFDWYRTDAKTDPDNIAFAQKFILDGIVKAGVLQDDGWKQIKTITHRFNLADENYVLVNIDSASRYKVDGE